MLFINFYIQKCHFEIACIQPTDQIPKPDHVVYDKEKQQILIVSCSGWSQTIFGIFARNMNESWIFFQKRWKVSITLQSTRWCLTNRTKSNKQKSSDLGNWNQWKFESLCPIRLHYTKIYDFMNRYLLRMEMLLIFWCLMAGTQAAVETHHADSRTQRLKVLLVLGVKADGTAGIHAVEGHLFRRGTVKGLGSGRGRQRQYFST